MLLRDGHQLVDDAADKMLLDAVRQGVEIVLRHHEVVQFRMAGAATSAARSSAAPTYSASAPAYRPAARPAAAAAETRPVASPARKMVGNLAKAFGGGNTAAAASQDNWEEF